jgi:hypothetical protein
VVPTDFENSWADDHLEIRALLGVGGEWGIDSPGPQGSRYQIAEWDYPDIGIVICVLPSGGDDTIMLDYTERGPREEPRVVYVDEDREVHPLADTFEDFVALLEPVRDE